jgi:hypothetical protein
MNLDCGNLQLTSLPILPNSLSQLACGFNQLTSLPSIPNVTILVCNNNLLTILPNLSNSISQLDCSSNQLVSLPFVPNVMNQFKIDNNNISCLSNLPQTFWTPSSIANNPLNCVPNQTNYSLGLPLCIDNDSINNPNNCPAVGLISGFIYSDLDNNCVYNNSNDDIAENIPVKLFDSQNNLIASSITYNGYTCTKVF